MRWCPTHTSKLTSYIQLNYHKTLNCKHRRLNLSHNSHTVGFCRSICHDGSEKTLQPIPAVMIKHNQHSHWRDQTTPAAMGLKSQRQKEARKEWGFCMTCKKRGIILQQNAFGTRWGNSLQAAWEIDFFGRQSVLLVNISDRDLGPIATTGSCYGWLRLQTFKGRIRHARTVRVGLFLDLHIWYMFVWATSRFLSTYVPVVYQRTRSSKQRNTIVKQLIMTDLLKSPRTYMSFNDVM